MARPAKARQVEPAASAPGAAHPMNALSGVSSADPIAFAPAGLGPTAGVPTGPWSALVFRLAALFGIVWIVALVCLVLTSANPAVISTEQFEAADALVTAHRVGPTTIAIDDVWFGSVNKETQTIMNLDDLESKLVPTGARQFYFPLTLKNGHWWLTSLGAAKPRVYPANTSHSELVRKFLRAHPRPRVPAPE